MKNKKWSKLLLTIGVHFGSAYLVSQGHAQEAAILSGIAQGSYNLDQGKEDLIKGVVDKAINDFAGR